MITLLYNYRTFYLRFRDIFGNLCRCRGRSNKRFDEVLKNYLDLKESDLRAQRVNDDCHNRGRLKGIAM